MNHKPSKKAPAKMELCKGLFASKENYQQQHHEMTRRALLYVHRIDIAEDMATEILVEQWEKLPSLTELAIMNSLFEKVQLLQEQDTKRKKAENNFRMERLKTDSWQKRFRLDQRLAVQQVALLLQPTERQFLEWSLHFELDFSEIAFLLPASLRSLPNIRDRAISRLQKMGLGYNPYKEKL